MTKTQHLHRARRGKAGRRGCSVVTSNSSHFKNNSTLLLLLIFTPCFTFSLLLVILPPSPGNQPYLPHSDSSPSFFPPHFLTAFQCTKPVHLLPITDTVQPPSNQIYGSIDSSLHLDNNINYSDNGSNYFSCYKTTN